MLARLAKGAAQCGKSGRIASTALASSYSYFGTSTFRVLPSVAMQSTLRRTFSSAVQQQQGTEAFIQPSEQRVHELLKRLDVDRSASFRDLDTKFLVLCAVEKEFAFVVRHADLHRISDVGSLVGYVVEREAERAAQAEAEAMHWTHLVPSNVTLKLQRAPRASELEFEEGELDEGGLRDEQQDGSGDGGDGNAAEAADTEAEEAAEAEEGTAQLGNDVRRSVLMPRARKPRAPRRRHSKSGNRKL